MRITTLAAVAALGLVAACAEPENRDEAQLSDEATVTEYGASADQAAARANAAANAANAAARDAANPDIVVVDPNPDDNVTIQVGPDGTRVTGSVNTD